MNSTENEEKEIVVSEIKSPTTSEETVEAAKQILADVLTKAVDAIKDSPSLSASVSDKEEEKFWTFNPNKVFIDETYTDFVVRCTWEGKTCLVGDGNTFAKSMASAKSFATEKEALEYIEKYQPGEKQTCVSFPFTDGEVMMRTMKCRLNEIGHG